MVFFLVGLEKHELLMLRIAGAEFPTRPGYYLQAAMGRPGWVEIGEKIYRRDMRDWPEQPTIQSTIERFQ